MKHWHNHTGDVMALCGNYQLLGSILRWQNYSQLFMKLAAMTHGTVYCLITLKLRDKTHPKLNWVCYCSLYSVVLTVPDKAPFSTGTDAAHPPHRSAAAAFHPRLPACSPNTQQVIEEMDLCWTGVSLLLKLTVRGCKVGTVGTDGWQGFWKTFHNIAKRILPNSPVLTER